MKVVDISGMDPTRARFGYEWGCQIILCRALRWLQRNCSEGKTVPQFLENPQIVGVTIPNDDGARAMEKYIFDHQGLRKYGATGAMVQFALHHAFHRFTLGDDAYLAKAPPNRVFDFDEADAFPEDAKGAATT